MNHQFISGVQTLDATCKLLASIHVQIIQLKMQYNKRSLAQQNLQSSSARHERTQGGCLTAESHSAPHEQLQY